MHSSSVMPLLAALLFLCAAASCAPTPAAAGAKLQDPCAKVRESSRELNNRAKNFSAPAVNGRKEELKFNFSFPWIETADLCDPKDLKESPAKCLGKMLGVLRSYISIMPRVEQIANCSQFANSVMGPMENLKKDLELCVEDRGAKNQVKEFDMSVVLSSEIGLWQQAPLCTFTKDRLFSFSIMSARVFAAGDPAQHAQGSAHRCM